MFNYNRWEWAGTLKYQSGWNKSYPTCWSYAWAWLQWVHDKNHSCTLNIWDPNTRQCIHSCLASITCHFASRLADDMESAMVPYHTHNPTALIQHQQHAVTLPTISKSTNSIHNETHITPLNITCSSTDITNQLWAYSSTHHSIEHEIHSISTYSTLSEALTPGSSIFNHHSFTTCIPLTTCTDDNCSDTLQFKLSAYI